MYPMLLDADTGTVHDAFGVTWFAAWLRDSYATRSSEALPLEVETCRKVTTPVLINCLDTLYGHSLLKLLNTQYYLDHEPDFDPIVLVPRFLRWMVPDGVAEIWTVDVQLRNGTRWSDWLAEEIQQRIKEYPSCMLSVGFPHPRRADFDIERFTRVAPFDLDTWQDKLGCAIVTFIWREDRLWREHLPLKGERLIATRRITANRARRRQVTDIVRLARELRRSLPNVDFAVAGFGKRGGMPLWIQDLRVTEIKELTEREWCERYATSHVVIGVHGSNMLLPSAHAGSVVDLMPRDRWGNLAQDILFRDAPEPYATLTHRFLPTSTRPAVVASVVASLLLDYPGLRLSMGAHFNDHLKATLHRTYTKKDAYREGVISENDP